MLNSLALTLGRGPLSSGGLLHGTLLGTHITLLGLNDNGSIVARQAFTRDDSLLKRTTAAAAPVIVFDDQHPLAADDAPDVMLPDSKLYFLPQGYPTLLGTGQHVTVTGWMLVGLDPDDPADMDPLAPAQGGQGRFGLGVSLSYDAREALATEGRLLLQWTCSALTLERERPMPSLLTGIDGVTLRDTVTTLHGVYTHPQTYEAAASATATNALLCLDLNSLFDVEAVDRQLQDLTQVGRAVSALGGRVLTQRHGSDNSASPLPTHPSPSGVLLDVRAEGRSTLGGFNLDGTGDAVTNGVDFTANAFSGDTAQRTAYYRHPFVWPEQEGVKFSAVLDDPSYGDNAGVALKLCPLEGLSTSHSPAAVEIAHNLNTSWGPRVSTFTGYTNSLINRPSSVELRPDTGRTVKPLKGQRYEVYIFPNRRAYLFANGVYVHEFEINGCAFRPGTEYTLSITARAGDLTLREAKVERFPVPADYTLNEPAPRITMMDWSQFGTVDEGALAADNSATGFVLSRYDSWVSFVVTQRSYFTLRASLNNSPSTESTYFQLARADGLGSFNVRRYAHSGSYTYPEPLEPGRYQLYLRNGSYRVSYRHCEEVRYWKYGWKTRWDCETRYRYYNTSHTLTVDHWRVDPVEDAT